jgi:hypothetical protein
MKQSGPYIDSFAIRVQNHQELQLDALRELYRKRLLELNRLKAVEIEKENTLNMLRSLTEEKSQTIHVLKQHLIVMSQMLESVEMRVSYDQDYSQRQQYYIQFSRNEYVRSEILDSLEKKWKNYKGVIVSPDGLRFQNERVKGFLEKLSEAGFLCFSFNEKIELDVVRIAVGYYEYKDEVLLLDWLMRQQIAPKVLCTWVLQSAWFDLLKSKTIWYDICENENVLGGLDASSKLKHYDLLKQAALVTYSDKKLKRHVSSRRDAVLLGSNQPEYIVNMFNERLEVRK